MSVFVNALDVPSLQIQPDQKLISKEVGASLALTCRPRVQDPRLITQLEWRDPYGRRIEKYNRTSPIMLQHLSEEVGVVLIFTSLSENQAGNYTCRGVYSNSETLSASIEVQTYVDIKFVDAPENQFPIVGKNFKVKCKVQGDPPPIVDWSRGDITIRTDDKYVVNPDDLLIRNVTELDDGVYKCTAFVSNTGQIKSRNIMVEVQIPPRMEPIDPQRITIIDGESAFVKCKATGKPPPSYQWIKLEERKDLSVTDRFEVKKATGELIVNRAEYNDKGTYQCIATNSAGRANTTVTVDVYVKPKIFELLNVTSAENSSTEITCKAFGRPLPRVTFMKLSTKEVFTIGRQPQDRRIILEQQVFDSKGETFGTLHIDRLNRSDDGLYECRADNEAGAYYKNGHITVEFAPTFERTKNLPPVYGWYNKPGNLSCIPEAIPNATITWKHNGVDLRNTSNIEIHGKGPTSNLIVRAYNELRLYSVYICVASNKHGVNELPLTLHHATVPEVAQMTVESITATTIKFSIIPKGSFEGLPIRSYTIQYKPKGEFDWSFARNHTWSFGAPYYLENLVPEETYHFRVAATNDVGTGHFLNVQSQTMPRRSVPAEPKILVSTHKEYNMSDREDMVIPSPYADHFELRWNVPSDNGEPILHYLVRYCVISGRWHDKDCSEQIQQSVQYTSYQLDSLRPDTVYKVELRAHNSIGDSSPAQIRVRTARGEDPIVPMQKAGISSGLIIGIVVAVIILVLILLDITCFFVNRLGVIALCCGNGAKQSAEDDAKLSREEHEPLKQDEKQISVEFDGRHVYSKTGEIIGKHSAV
nr:unnamed protein product [Callosobruchus analis]